MAWLQCPHTDSTLEFDHHFQITEPEGAVKTQRKETMVNCMVCLDSLKPTETFLIERPIEAVKVFQLMGPRNDAK